MKACIRMASYVSRNVVCRGVVVARVFNFGDMTSNVVKKFVLDTFDSCQTRVSNIIVNRSQTNLVDRAKHFSVIVLY